MAEATRIKSRWPAFGCVTCIALAGVGYVAFQLFAMVMGGFVMIGGAPTMTHARYDGFYAVSRDHGHVFYAVVLENVANLSSDFTIESPDIGRWTVKEFMEDASLVRESLKDGPHFGGSESWKSCQLSAFMENERVDELRIDAQSACRDEEIVIKFRGRAMNPPWSRGEMEEMFGKDYRFE